MIRIVAIAGTDTVTAILPETEPMAAVTVTEPTLAVLSSPEAAMVATVLSEVCQLTCEVSVCVLWSE